VSPRWENCGSFVIGEERIVLIEDFKCEWNTFLYVSFEVRDCSSSCVESRCWEMTSGD
jgi:hypothetical protein